MADIVTGTVTGQLDTTSLLQDHSDIRREAAEHTGEILKETARSAFDTVTRVENSADRVNSAVTNGQAALTAQFFTVARDTADLRAQVIQAIDTTKMATELNSLKSIIEGQKNTTYLSDKIGNDGDKTRALINELKYGDLNRALIERNAEIVEERHHARHWHGRADQSQYAAMNSQLQAFQSQLQETRQGMVNFGTMSGQSGQQTSTANNVR